jgi:hypothetical protein
VPEKIENFGITFAATERTALLAVFLGVLVYYLLAFAVYAWSDYLNHSNKVHEASSALRHKREDSRPLELGRVQDEEWRLVGQVKPVSSTRIIFDFYVTGLVALFAILSLLIALSAPAKTRTPANVPAHYSYE